MGVCAEDVHVKRTAVERGTGFVRARRNFQVAISVAVPVLAQTPAAPVANRSPAAPNVPATHNTPGDATGGGYNPPSAWNAVMTDNGGVRASKVVGSSVYNDHDEKIGSIDDLVIGSDKTPNAVVCVGGFPGMGSKMVEVRFDKPRLGNTKDSSDTRVVMTGLSNDALTAKSDYHYANNG